MSAVTRIRATHPYAFRSGEWGHLVNVITDPETDRECYLVEFPDGEADLWPVTDETHGYEFDGTMPG